MRPTSDDIAIVGMSCKAPGGATSPEKLWQLCVEARNAWSEIPTSRFNQKDLYHPQGEHPGKLNVLGAHFLDEDISLFDASFFALSAEVASSMDPQFRLQLESTFEALENAGLPLAQVAASNTAVFAGAFFHDYQDSLVRDPDNLPRYALTGNGAAMLSNRVSHFFDLRGPSVTVDTGCSTGLAALHLACQSIRTGEANMAIVGGANILLNPDNYIAMSCLGLLGPTGKSYSFDSRAEGFGRGEGVATIVIKPLAAALKNGDSIRAVIKSTLLNQDGKTPTITSPSQEAQQELIRQCYANAGLDPRDTHYVEAHGTGTKTGDKLEFAALSHSFDLPGRTHPLYVGSLKTNIGHLEAASGIAAIVKVALALEKGIIPPTTNFEIINPELQLENSNVVINTHARAWPSESLRRASISNFGYGGTNAHVIMEQVGEANTIPHVNESLDTNDAISAQSWSGFETFHEVRSKVVVLSAKDEHVVLRMAASLADYLEAHDSKDERFWNDLCFTLGSRRSRFPWSMSYAVGDVAKLSSILRESNQKPRYASKAPRIGFVFTGQGAQWHAMGRELIFAYPVYAASLRRAEKCLQQFGASWSLLQELQRDESSSRVHEAEMGMPISTAIQLALVDLLRNWGVRPNAVTGHSSGEAAAAYAAGAIDFSSALAVSYFRGVLTSQYHGKTTAQGGMLAVGLGEAAVASFLDTVADGRVVVACINSPSSVTLSGDLAPIEEIESKLETQKIFARRLKVPAAYHSHHMLPQVEDYKDRLLSTFGTVIEKFDGVRYISPVTGAPVLCSSQLGPMNWVKNMIKPVLFAPALRNMCYNSTTPVLDLVLEIGPHSALAGPIRQTLKPLGEEIGYLSCLHRGKDAVSTLQEATCALLGKGYPVNLAAVNDVSPRNSRPLKDLPSYPWKHSVSYWIEPRINKDHRERPLRSHDLLGSMVLGCDTFSPTWRQTITPLSVPWVRDHVVQSKVLYPGAGYICMAIEACRILLGSDGSTTPSFEVADVKFRQGLVIPDSGIEVQFKATRRSERILDSVGWYDFQVASVDSQGAWTEHCTGSVSAREWIPTHTAGIDWNAQKSTTYKPLRSDEFYGAMRVCGIEYGNLFKNLSGLGSSQGSARGQVSLPNTAAIMPGKYQDDHLVHPATLDALFQLSYVAILDGGLGSKATMVPTRLARLTVSAQKELKDDWKCLAQTQAFVQSSLDAALVVLGETGLPLLEVTSLHCETIGSALITSPKEIDVSMCMTPVWMEDFTLQPADALHDALQSCPDEEELQLIPDVQRASFHLIHDALDQLKGDDPMDFEWHHRLFHEWMLHQLTRAKQNDLGPNSSRWLKTSTGVKEQLYDKVQASSATGEMIRLIGQNLVRIFRKEVTPLELMLEGGLLHRYYEKALRIDNAYKMIRPLMKSFSHKFPRANILEIGGGTGGCTLPVLQALTSFDGARDVRNFAHYTFTDISSGFFTTAKDKLAQWGSAVSYKRLDIENSPVEQGFAAGGYDLIVACLVLHATKDMENTMRNVRSLLKPGGRLIMVETTNDQLDLHLIFGTVPGWWLSVEPERKLSPNLPTEMWQDVLGKTGFSGLDLAVQDSRAPADHCLSLLMSTATPVEDHRPETALSVVYAGTPPPQAWQDVIRSSASLVSPADTTFDQLATAKNAVAGRICFIVDDFAAPMLQNISPQAFANLKTIIAAARGVVWIALAAGMAQGLMRVLRLENSSKRFISIDLDGQLAPDVASNARAISSIIEDAFVKKADFSSLVESEFQLRDSKVLIPRLVHDSDKSRRISGDDSEPDKQTQPWRFGSRVARLAVGSPGSLGTLRFDEITTPSFLGRDEVEIEPQAFGLNFRDIMVALGQLQSTTMGFECAGLVTAVGQDCHDFQVGDRVLALTNGHWSNRTRAPSSCVARMPANMPFEEAASIPVVFLTAMYSLVEVARLQVGETVLIHAASGGVGQAAIMIAQHLQAEIYATVSTAEKRAMLVATFGIPDDHIFSSRDASFAPGILRHTSGQGVDVVLNSLGGNLLQETWRCIAEFGRFVEIGKKDIEQSRYLDMRPFVKASSFTAVDVLRLAAARPRTVSRCLTNVMDLFGRKVISPVRPLTKFSVENIPQAFRTMARGKHIGKIVVTAKPDDRVEVIPRRDHVALQPDASYVIVGGIGGLGRSLVTFLAKCGAKHIVLISRSAEQQDLTSLIDGVAARGCSIYPFSCDVTQSATLRAVLERIQESSIPSVKGLLQGAMVLDDSIFENMEHRQWEAATKPKVQGTLTLHEAFGDSLDFFVMLSSLVGITGHASQGNYAAGGSFQDAFAHWRQQQGLPTVSVDLGFIQSVGYVADTKGVAERMAQMGYIQIPEPKLWRIVESAIHAAQSRSGPTQMVTGLASYRESDDGTVAWRQDARFGNLVAQDDIFDDTDRARKTQSKMSLHKRLMSAENDADAITLICNALIEKLSAMFSVPQTEVDQSQPVSFYGVDSLVAVELRNWVFTSTQAELSIFEVLQSTSLQVLAKVIASRVPS